MEQIKRGVTVELAHLLPHPRNYNLHSDAQLERLKLSLVKFGQVAAVVVQAGPQEKYNVGPGEFLCVCGHGVAAAAGALQWPALAADVLPASYPEEKVLAYMAADNELARLAMPDEAQLAALVAEVETFDEELAALAAGSEERLGELLAELNIDDLLESADPKLEKLEELQKKWRVEKGQLWEIPGRGGVHRLWCGDSTGDVSTLGELPKNLFYDPPWDLELSKPEGSVL